MVHADLSLSIEHILKLGRLCVASTTSLDDFVFLFFLCALISLLGCSQVVNQLIGGCVACD